MKDKDTELRKLNELSHDDIERFEYVITELKSLIYNKKITEKTLQRLTQITQVITFIRNEHSDNLITWLKQGYILDED
tara:strand:- start:174 stop:407 length:234 start_codon:yes stop_codon:yes gene_type:complete